MRARSVAPTSVARRRSRQVPGEAGHLAAIARSALSQDPFSSHLYVCSSRRGDRVLAPSGLPPRRLLGKFRAAPTAPCLTTGDPERRSRIHSNAGCCRNDGSPGAKADRARSAARAPFRSTTSPHHSNNIYRRPLRHAPSCQGRRPNAITNTSTSRTHHRDRGQRVSRPIGETTAT